MPPLYIERFIRYSRFVGVESRDFAKIIFFKKVQNSQTFLFLYLNQKQRHQCVEENEYLFSVIYFFFLSAFVLPQFNKIWKWGGLTPPKGGPPNG